MRRFIGVALVALASMAVTCAGAQTAEQAYDAARDAAIARVKALNHPVGPTDPTPQEAIDEDNRSLAALEEQMHAIVGPVAITGMTGNGKINLDTLNDGFEDFGLLDGMVYGGLDEKTRVIVTTESLFKHWLDEHMDAWNKSGDALENMGAVVKKGEFLFARRAHRCRHIALHRSAAAQAAQGFRDFYRHGAGR